MQLLDSILYDMNERSDNVNKYRKAKEIDRKYSFSSNIPGK